MLKTMLVALAAGLGFGASAFAADLPADAAPVEQALPPPAVSGWQLSLTPYIWASGISGDIGHSGRTLAHVNYDFTKIVDTMNFAAMGMAEVRYDRFSLSSDLIYLRVTDKFAVTRIGLDRAKVGVGLLQWTPLAGYAVYQDGRNSLELVAGARVWSLETTIGVGLVRLGDHEAEVSNTWVDAVGGIRGRAFLTDNFFLSGWALAGGGGSDYMWDVMGGIGYRFNDMFSATAGYRAQQVKFGRAGFVFDVSVHGPMVGVQVNF